MSDIVLCNLDSTFIRNRIKDIMKRRARLLRDGPINNMEQEKNMKCINDLIIIEIPWLMSVIHRQQERPK